MTTATSLVESYLRLNGYFTVTEFQVQHPKPGEPGAFETATDVDILAVRLPWAARTVVRAKKRGKGKREEILLGEDPALGVKRNMMDILIGEVKEGEAELNRRLTSAGVLYTVLRRTGCTPERQVAAVAERLRRNGEAVTRRAGVACRVRLASFCGYVEEPPAPARLVITLDHAFRFIEERLAEYQEVLRSAQFADPTLGMLKLMRKVGIGLDFSGTGKP